MSATALEESIRAAGAPALIALCADRLDLDEDDVAAATRRGLLLAAAGGDPSEAIGPGSRAALETAAELQALGTGTERSPARSRRIPQSRSARSQRCC